MLWVDSGVQCGNGEVRESGTGVRRVCQNRIDAIPTPWPQAKLRGLAVKTRHGRGRKAQPLAHDRGYIPGY